MFSFIINSIKLLNGSNKDFRKALKKITGFCPGNIKLYETAFIHRSASNIKSNIQIDNNERLEYLGDAVFDTIIADYLYNHFPYRNEGFLTKMKSKIVNRENMDMLASKIGLDNLIIANIGRHEGKHLSGNTLEALIGAVYLDKGYLKAQKFVLKKIIKKFIDFQELEAQDFNYKSILVELCQKNKKIVVFETSETATSPSFFTSIALVENQNYGTGKGFSKKEAEQNAAEKALNRLKETSEDTCFNIKL